MPVMNDCKKLRISEAILVYLLFDVMLRLTKVLSQFSLTMLLL